MPSRLGSLIPLVLTALAAAAPVALAAEDQPTASALQEVVVTAQKREEKLHDVPMGVTAVTADDLQQLRLVDFEDLQSQVPGLSVTQVQPGQTRLSIRGQNVGSDGSTVTTYIDNTPFGSSNALANGSLLSGDFDTWDLKRVEVLRGPQGTLYGAGSEGGLVKYVTNPPDPTRLTGALELGGEDFAHGGSGASGKGMVNLPIGDRAAFRLSGTYTTVPGYIDDPQLGTKDVNHGDREGLRASFLAQATDTFSVRLDAFGERLHTDGTPYIDVIGNAGTPLTPPANQLQLAHDDYSHIRYIDEPTTFRYRLYSATLDWNLGFGSLTAITSYGTSGSDQFTDATSIALQPGVSFGDLASLLAGQKAGVAETALLDVKKFTEEVRLASSSANPLTWQLGAFYTHESSTLDQTLPSFFIPSQAPTGLSIENASLDSIYKEFSAFGEATYRFNPQFDLALGGRWSENRQSADESLTSPLFPPQTTSGTSSGTDFTYSVAPRWHVSSDTMAYARIASGYRPGGPNALPPGAPAGVPSEYHSDSTVNYELGSRTSVLGNRLSIDVAAFYVDWSKIQLLEYVQNVGVNTNGGTARSKGLEWTFGLTPVTGLTFRLAGAYVNAYLTAPAPDAGGNDGDPLPYVPKWSNSLDGAYRWHAFGNYGAFAGATWNYIGSRFSDFSSSTQVVGGAVVAVPNPRAELGGYSTVNLRLGLDSERWLLELYCKNVGDTRGLIYYTNSGTPNFGGSIGLTQPRTIGAAVTARF